MILLILLPGPLLALSQATKQGMTGEACDDGYIDCSYRAEQCGTEDYSELLQMMTHCRQTCRRYFQDRAVPDKVLELGGVEEEVVDVFGEEMAVCSLQEGVDSVLRFSLLRHRLATVLQPAWLPSFTARGWEVDQVPGRLMGMINIARLNGIKMMEEEPCLAQTACFNCQKLLEDKRECSLPGTRCTLYTAQSWIKIFQTLLKC